jgi:lauroyl/myristoyl acyltransferase
VSFKIISLNDLYLLTVIALVTLANAIPSHRAKRFIAESIAQVAFHLSRSKRRRCEENLARVFGSHLTHAEIQTIARESFRECWLDIFSMQLSKTERAALKWVELRGMEHLTAALNKGCGVILLETSFFGQRNLAKQILHERGISVHQVHHVQHLGGFKSTRQPSPNAISSSVRSKTMNIHS